MKLIRRTHMDKGLLIAISTINNQIKISSLKQLTEDIYEIEIEVDDSLLNGNYSIWEDIFTINSLCASSLNKNNSKTSYVNRRQNSDNIGDLLD